MAAASDHHIRVVEMLDGFHFEVAGILKKVDLERRESVLATSMAGTGYPARIPAIVAACWTLREIEPANVPVRIASDLLLDLAAAAADCLDRDSGSAELIAPARLPTQTADDIRRDEEDARGHHQALIEEYQAITDGTHPLFHHPGDER